MNSKILLAAMLGASLFKDHRDSSDLPFNAEGMNLFHAKQRKAKALERPSKRKLRKLKGKCK